MQTNDTSYAVYHSVHDNFYWMSHFGDPDFSHHLAIGLVWIKTAMLLTTTPVLPYDPRDYALTVQDIFTGVMSQYGNVLKQQGISLGRGVSLGRPYGFSIPALCTEPIPMNDSGHNTINLTP